LLGAKPHAGKGAGENFGKPRQRCPLVAEALDDERTEARRMNVRNLTSISLDLCHE